MIGKKIKSVDFNGVEREETYYFNLTEQELAEMELSQDGGMDVYIKRIVDAKSVPELIALFKKFINASYGIKSDDGKYFRKSAELLADFQATQAYSDLYMELVSNTEAAIEFVNGVIPTKMKSAIPADHPALK